MICKVCGAEFNDASKYCPSCGTPTELMNTNTSQSNNGGDYFNQNQNYDNTGYSQPEQNPYSYGQYIDYPNGYVDPGYTSPMNNMQQQQQVSEPVPTLGKYLVWFILAALPFPLTNIVLTIVFACMSDNKNRANFFRAKLILMAIVVVLSIIVTVICVIAGFSLMGITEDILYDFM